MKNPLRSKDLDLLSNQVGPHQIEALAEQLSTIEQVECRTTTLQTRRFNNRKMTTYTIELRVAGRPFFIELFDRILDGRLLSILEPYVEPRKRWNLEVWTPTREAVVALRLAFRRPEGVTRLNAMRLNSFIQENQQSLKFNLIASILEEWGILDWVEKNLIELYRRHGVRILNDQRMVPRIERKLSKHSVKTEKMTLS